MASLVGSRVERKEDKKFLTGKGRYTADITLAHQTHAVFVRSPHARAQIKKVDTSKALKASGVVAVLTGKDLADDKIGGLIAGWKIVSEDGTDMKVPAHPALATETVNYVGDHKADKSKPVQEYNYKKLLKRLKILGIVATVFKSKSGGAHIKINFDEKE